MRQLVKIISGLLVILATAVAMDFMFGLFADRFFLDKVYSKTQYSMMSDADADIVVFGSSRASHHYDTPFMTDSLGIKSYNAGQDGRGLTFHLPLLKSYLRHNAPDIVLLELLPTMDGYWNDRISMLFPLSDIDESIVEEAYDINPYYSFYLKSNLYRHNSNLVDEVKARLHPYDLDSRGFDPLVPDKKHDFESLQVSDEGVGSADSIETKALVDIIKTCRDKNIKLVAVISPIYGEVKINRRLLDVLENENVMFLDNRALDLGSDRAKYFNDPMHMNALGARKYTEFVTKQLRDSVYGRISSSLSKMGSADVSY